MNKNKIRDIAGKIDGLFGAGTFAHECKALDEAEGSSAAADELADYFDKFLQFAKDNPHEIQLARNALRNGWSLLSWLRERAFYMYWDGVEEI